MRREFHPLLLDLMRKDERIWVCTADLGYKMWDAIAKEFPDRFVNVGVSEQLLLGAGIGLAEQDQIPICYSITPFLLKRPFEWIDNYLHHENVPTKLLGGGRLREYHEDGYTHDATCDKQIMKCWPNIKTYWPENLDELKTMTNDWLYNKKPSYLNLKR